MQISRNAAIGGAVVLALALTCGMCSCATAMIAHGGSPSGQSTTAKQAYHAAPTATAQPTATPNPNDPAKVQIYKNVVATDSQTLGDDATVMGNDCGAQNYSLCTSDVQTIITDTHAFQADLNATPTPPCMKPADVLLRKGLSVLDTGSHNMLNGLNNFNVSDIDLGSSQYKQATNYITQAKSAMDSASC